MSTARDRLLERVRTAVSAGNRAGLTPSLAPRGEVGYQGAGTDLAGRFCAELTTAGGVAYRVEDNEKARSEVLELVRVRSPRRVLLGTGSLLDSLDLSTSLAALGIQVTAIPELRPETCRAPLFAADLGVSGIDYLIAETGSLALLARPSEPRSLSLLPPVHIVVAKTAQILPDLFDLFALMQTKADEFALPSCLTIITGPSKTGDIELKLVTGVHGPGEVHVVLIEG